MAITVQGSRETAFFERQKAKKPISKRYTRTSRFVLFRFAGSRLVVREEKRPGNAETEN